jgi:heptosyltransferase-2
MYLCAVGQITSHLAKFLILRFSSIGDIVLTSPVIRCLKQQVKDAEVHFLTRDSYKSTLENNPYIDRLWTTDGSLKDVLPALKAEGFDEIIDLHNNLRTLKIKRALGVPSYSFPKLNIQKWMLVNLHINRMPAIHIVDRYLSTIKHRRVFNDLLGLDYFITTRDVVEVNRLPESHRNGYVAFVIGAKHNTKILTAEKMIHIVKLLNYPVVLLGGKEDRFRGEEIVESGNNGLIFNACGEFKLNESASLLQQAKVVLSHDTGLMHIAAAFQKPIVSVWGNTVPDFGMTPYLPQVPGNSKIMEVSDLSCRPCSKIGYERCPKGHFDCMNLQDEQKIVAAVRSYLK